MTQENKELLLRDLCARLPYGVKTTYKDIIMEIFVVSTFLDNMCCLKWDSHKGYYNQTHAHIGQFKPYLRPMSSMTEEERKEYTSLCNRQDIDTPTWSKIIWHDTYKSIDWLNKKMFAYRTIDGKDMFELGIAIEAPEGMYK